MKIGEVVKALMKLDPEKECFIGYDTCVFASVEAIETFNESGDAILLESSAVGRAPSEPKIKSPR